MQKLFDFLQFIFLGTIFIWFLFFYIIYNFYLDEAIIYMFYFIIFVCVWAVIDSYIRKTNKKDVDNLEEK